MATWEPTDEHLSGVYAAFWRFMDMSVHRYGSSPTGQVFMVITIMMLDRVDHHPTVGELAEMTRLPKSTISRYVAVEMGRGMLAEVIDPGDRRRRRLHLTAEARKEGLWHREKVREVAALSARAFNDEDLKGQGIEYWDKVLRGGSNTEDSQR